MKKIFLLVFLFCISQIANSQWPIVQNLGSDSTLIRVGPTYGGGLKGNIISMTYADTATANLTRVRQYEGSIIFTSTDSSAWFRGKGANIWIRFGSSGGSLTGTPWYIGGNPFPVLPTPAPSIGTLAPWGGGFGLMTNSVIRAIVPDGGFALSNDTSVAKVFTWNPTTKEWGYANWNNGGGSGATPTLQQVLATQSNTATITAATDISPSSNSYSLSFGNDGAWGDINFYSDEDFSVSAISSTISGSGSSGVNISSSNVTRVSNIVVGDSIFVRPPLGVANVDSLRTWSTIDDSASKRMMTWDKRNGRWEYFDGYFPTKGGTSSSDTIAMTYQVWVDSAYGNDATGVVGNPAKPFETINAALDATSALPKVRVNIGLGSYDRIDSSKIRSNLVILGSGQPMLNNYDTATTLVTLTTTRPTKLVGGTIILGGLQIRNKPSNLEIAHLGFDNGADFVALGNRKWDALDIRDPGTATAATPPLPQMKGIYIHDITCLGDTSNSAYHALTLENCIDPVVDNVLLVGNTHGLAVKTIGGLYSNITSFWHSSDGIILKINNYAPSHEMVLNGFVIRSLSETTKESGGLVLQNETGVNVRTGWVISNGTIRFTSEGVRDYANGDYYNVNISNITIHKTTNSGIYTVGMAKSTINNVIIDSVGGHGMWIDNATGGNIVTGSRIDKTSYSGISIDGGTDSSFVSGNVIKNNANYGILANDGTVKVGFNDASNNTLGNYSGTIVGVPLPYLASGAKSIAGATVNGLLYPLYIGSGLSIATGGGVDTLKSSGGVGGSTVVSDSAWMRTGNTANAATDFIGTKNSASFRIKTNNTQRAYYDSLGNYYFYTPAVGTEFWIGAYNDPDFFKVGIAGSAAKTVTIGDDAATGYTRLRIVGYDDSVPLLWLGNGGTETNIKFFRYSTNQMGATTPNYNNYPFTFDGNYEFQDKVSIGTVLGANAPTMALQIAGRFGQGKGANVAAANDLTLGSDGNVFHITGATQVNAITVSNWRAGSEITLIFDSTPTVKNNTAGGAGTAVLLLAGGADFSATANDVLKLVYDGTSWFEVSRSVN